MSDESAITTAVEPSFRLIDFFTLELVLLGGLVLLALVLVARNKTSR